MTATSQHSPRVDQDSARLLLNVEGMHCAGCVSSVQRALLEVPGVAQAHVNLLLRQATVQLDQPEVATRQLIEAV